MRPFTGTHPGLVLVLVNLQYRNAPMKNLFPTLFLGALLADTSGAQEKALASAQSEALDHNCRAEAIGVPGPTTANYQGVLPFILRVDHRGQLSSCTGTPGERKRRHHFPYSGRLRTPIPI